MKIKQFFAFVCACLVACMAVRAELPLKPTRTVSFETTEGTWMSVDVSPNGTTLVFDLLGDLYTLPIGGGNATRITSGMAWDVQPRFSPDGQTILFVSDRGDCEEVWTVGRDGQGAKLAIRNPNREAKGIQFQWKPVGPIWLPDGRVVVKGIRTGIGTDIFVHNLTDRSSKRLELGSYSITPMSPRLLPDGESIYVSVKPAGVAHYQVMRVHVGTGGRTFVTSGDRPAMRPVPSPDGKLLAYITNIDGITRLVILDLTTGQERMLPGAVQNDMSHDAGWIDHFPGYSFTPDSRRIIVMAEGKFWSIDAASGERAPIPFVAQVEQQLGPLVKFDFSDSAPEVAVKQIRAPVLSPDEKYLAFEALGQLWVHDIAAKRTWGLPRSQDLEGQPSWSPDGQYVAYTTWNAVGQGDLYRIRADKQCMGAGRCKPEKLSQSPGYYRWPTYSPDGRSLVAMRSSGRKSLNGSDLVVMPATGGVPRTLTSVGDTYAVPYFCAEADRVYVDMKSGFRAPTGAKAFSIKLDGTGREELFMTWGQSIRLSPDLKLAVGAHPRGIVLLKMPSNGQYPQKPVELEPEGSTSAAMPVEDIDRLGGEYSGWIRGGQALYYSLGRSFFIHDLVAAAKARSQGREYRPRRIDVNLHAARDKPRGTVVLSQARLLTMKGDEVIDNGDVVITDNRIVAIGPHGSVKIPEGARVMNLAGKTILPGYIDVHAHIKGVRYDYPDTQLYGLLPYLAYGVTTVRDPAPAGNPRSYVYDYQDRIATGDLIGPRYLSGPLVSYDDEGIRSQDDARTVLRRYSDEFHGSQTLKQYANAYRDTRQRIIMAAREYRIMPTNEGDRGKGMTFVLDGYPASEHDYTLPASPIYRDVAELVARSGTIVAATIVTGGGVKTGSYFLRKYNPHHESKLRKFLPHGELEQFSGGEGWNRDEQYLFPRMAADMGKIVAAGGMVSMGSHGDQPGIGNHYELWATASGGMRTLDVLKMGTLWSAASLGLDKELGSLEVGKLADLQILDADPLTDLQNISKIRYVIKNGRMYEAETLDEVWPRLKRFPRTWWMEE